MLIETPKILNRDICDKLITFYEANPQLLDHDNAQDLFNGTSMRVEHLTGELANALEALKSRVLIKAAQFYHLEELYLDFWSINKWTKGMGMPFHADNVDENQEPHPYCWWRDYSAVIYLNHDYKGGQTIFQNQNTRVVPTKGSGVIFPATYGYTHGVSDVEEGVRYTLAMWMTVDSKYAIIR